MKTKVGRLVAVKIRNSRKDLPHQVGFVLNPGQSLVQSTVFDGEALVVDAE